jgi:hypothetical protein
MPVYNSDRRAIPSTARAAFAEAREELARLDERAATPA